MIAAGWSNPEIAGAARGLLAGWYDLLTEVATEAAERFGGLGPFTPAEVGHAHRQRLHRRARRCCCSASTATQLPIRAALRRVGADHS